MIEIKYNGDNLEFLKELKDKVNCDDCLFRASEIEELETISKWGTDRGGYPPRNWEFVDHGITYSNPNIKYEDVIFATTEEDIINAEKDENKSSIFKKFDIIDHPILILYDIKGFEKIDDRQWLFLDPSNKKDYLRTIINVIK